MQSIRSIYTWHTVNFRLYITRDILQKKMDLVEVTTVVFALQPQQLAVVFICLRGLIKPQVLILHFPQPTSVTY